MKSRKFIMLLILSLLLIGCEYGGGTESTASLKNILWEEEETYPMGKTHKYIEEISAEEFREILNTKNPTKVGDKSFFFGTELLLDSEQRTYKKYADTFIYGDYGEFSLNIVYGDPINKWYVYWVEYKDGSDGKGVLEPFMKFDSELENLPEDAVSVRYGYTLWLDKVDDDTKERMEKIGLEQSEAPGFEYIFSGNFSTTVLMEDLYYKDLTKQN